MAVDEDEVIIKEDAAGTQAEARSFQLEIFY